MGEAEVGLLENSGQVGGAQASSLENGIQVGERRSACRGEEEVSFKWKGSEG